MKVSGSNIESLKDHLLSLVKEILIREALDALRTKASFLFVGPINGITKALVTKAISWGIENLSVFIDLKYAGFRTRSQLENMYEVLAKARQAKTTLTEEEKVKIDEAIQYTAFKLIHI